MQSKRTRCERCRKPGRPRYFTDPFNEEFEIVLCDACHAPLAFADAKAWKWVRAYVDRRSARQ